MEKVDIDDIIRRFENDRSSVYNMTLEQLSELLHLFGEDDHIIDAILVLQGASKEFRAAQQGLTLEEYRYFY